MNSASTSHSAISDWLNCSNPSEASNGALVQKISEIDRPTDLQHTLANELRDARFTPAVLVDYMEVLGIDPTSHIVRDLLPVSNTVRRGYFGEVLSACCLREFDDCWIPVQKLRSMISSDQSLPGVDVLGAQTRNGRIEALVFVEAKLRTNRESRIIVQATQELIADLKAGFPSILHFTAVELQKRNDPMYKPFMEYLGRRVGEEQDDLPYVYLVLEQGNWSDQDIRHLDELDPLPDGFRVSVIQIDNLAQLVDCSYSAIAVSPNDADDE